MEIKKTSSKETAEYPSFEEYKSDRRTFLKGIAVGISGAVIAGNKAVAGEKLPQLKGKMIAPAHDIKEPVEQNILKGEMAEPKPVEVQPIRGEMAEPLLGEMVEPAPPEHIELMGDMYEPAPPAYHQKTGDMPEPRSPERLPDNLQNLPGSKVHYKDGNVVAPCSPEKDGKKK